jgi:hypothetical protein
VICGDCGRDLDPDEPVWRERSRCGICTVCSDCRSWDFGDPSPCETCGRPVHNEWRSRPRRHVFCSERCASRWYNARQKAERDEARLKICEVCCEHFEAPRRDTKYCGTACKQKAYRHRVTDRKRVLERGFGALSVTDRKWSDVGAEHSMIRNTVVGAS